MSKVEKSGIAGKSCGYKFMYFNSNFHAISWSFDILPKPPRGLSEVAADPPYMPLYCLEVLRHGNYYCA